MRGASSGSHAAAARRRRGHTAVRLPDQPAPRALGAASRLVDGDQPAGQHPRPVGRHSDGVLEVRGEASRRPCRSTSRRRRRADLVVARGDHRLDREHHARRAARGRGRAARSWGPAGPRASPADAVADERAHHAEALPLDARLHRVPMSPRRLPGRHCSIARRRATARQVSSRPQRGLGDLADRDTVIAESADPAAVGHADVDRDHVAVAQRVRAGDAVHDHVVRRRADRAGEAVVALERGHAALGADELLGEPVELGGRDARPGLGRSRSSVRATIGPAAAMRSSSASRLADDHAAATRTTRRRSSSRTSSRGRGRRRPRHDEPALARSARAPARPSSNTAAGRVADDVLGVVVAAVQLGAVDVARRPATLGGASSDVVDVPVPARQTSRPDSRATSRPPVDHRDAISAVIVRPRSASMRSSASACGSVRGKPSSRKPAAVSGSAMPLARACAMVTSSGTSSPRLHVPCALSPSARARRVWRAEHVAGRDVRQPAAAQTRAAWVPFPAPGGPEDQVERHRLQEALVVAHRQLRLHLPHGVERHTHDDQDRGAAQRARRRSGESRRT